MPISLEAPFAGAVFTEIRGAQLTPSSRDALQVIAEAVVQATLRGRDGEGGDPSGVVTVTIEGHRLASDPARPEDLAELLTRIADIRLAAVGRKDGGRLGGALLAAWRLEETSARGRKRGGLSCRLLLTPLGVAALRDGSTRVRLDAEVARRLTGHAQVLLGLLDDRRSAGQWRVPLPELKARLGLAERYANGKDFRVRVIEPAVEAIAATGVLDLKAAFEMNGRAWSAVRFQWSLPSAGQKAAAACGQRNPTGEAAGLAAALAGEPPLVVRDRVSSWLSEQPLRVRRAWWGRAQELGAQKRSGATEADNIGFWVGWVADEVVAALADGRMLPTSGC